MKHDKHGRTGVSPGPGASRRSPCAVLSRTLAERYVRGSGVARFPSLETPFPATGSAHLKSVRAGMSAMSACAYGCCLRVDEHPPPLTELAHSEPWAGSEAGDTAPPRIRSVEHPG